MVGNLYSNIHSWYIFFQECITQEIDLACLDFFNEQLILKCVCDILSIGFMLFFLNVHKAIHFASIYDQGIYNVIDLFMLVHFIGEDVPLLVQYTFCKRRRAGHS